MTNSAAIGYMIIAAKELGFGKTEIEWLRYEMRRAMGEHTEEEAEEVNKKA